MTPAERREARDDLRSEIEEIDADLVGLVEEFRDVKERIALALKAKAALVARRNELRVTSVKG